MKAAELNKIYTIPEYFLLEESGEIRHEFIEGYLIEMSGVKQPTQKIWLTNLFNTEK
jgi:Uma2 family endonuclease